MGHSLRRVDIIRTEDNIHYANDGAKSHYAKITLDKVQKIRDLYASGKFGPTELGRKFGLHRSSIHRIVAHRTWR